MTDAPILSERVGHTQIITLNRPEAMNAITSQMLTDLNTALKAADDAPEVRAVVITGRRARLLLGPGSETSIRR